MIIMYKNYYCMYDKVNHTVVIADSNQNIIKKYNTYNRNVTYENMRNYIDIALIECNIKSSKCNEFYVIEPAPRNSVYGKQGDNSYICDLFTYSWDIKEFL